MSVFDEANAVLLNSPLSEGNNIVYYVQNGTSHQLKALGMDPRILQPELPGTYAVRWVRAADLPVGAGRKDLVMLGSEPYTVEDINLDGGGGAYILLQKQLS